MKTFSTKLAVLCLGLTLATSLTVGAAHAAAPTPVKGVSEDWKGPSDGSEVHFGALAGLGIIDFNAGFVLLGTASKKIVKSGFVPDITNSVSIEAEAGPMFVAGSTLFDYSLHLRWDFQKDDQWTLFAIGGVGGYIVGSSFPSANTFMLFPRLGLGAFFRVNDLLLIRGEVSHELIAAGVTIPLYL